MAPRALRDNMPEPPISHGQPRFGPSRNAKSAVPMTINNLIESVGLSAEELRRYLVAEIDEFLAASDPAAMEEEFGDALFALACMAWAHSGHHYRLGLDAAEAKLRQRLRDHATLARRPRRYADERIAEMEIGVVHFALGQFGGQWHQFDPLHNGTVAEVSLLTDAPFGRPGTLTNHCIVTFGDTDALTYDILYAAATTRSGNTIRCEIPNFMFDRAKKQLKFAEFGELLALQVLAGIDGIRLAPDAVAHFHSWEAGFLAELPEFWRRISTLKTIFSPYLTIGRLKTVFDARGGTGWTMTPEELAVAAHFERKLSEACMRVVLESSQDRDFFMGWVHRERLDVRSFARTRAASIGRAPVRDGRLAFVAGGRPVREKGFVELCRQFAQVRALGSRPRARGHALHPVPRAQSRQGRGLHRRDGARDRRRRAGRGGRHRAQGFDRRAAAPHRRGLRAHRSVALRSLRPHADLRDRGESPGLRLVPRRHRRELEIARLRLRSRGRWRPRPLREGMV